MQSQLADAKAEMENIKAVATVSESTKQEAIDQVKQQWQEEVASLQAIMKGRHPLKSKRFWFRFRGIELDFIEQWTLAGWKKNHCGFVLFPNVSLELQL